MKSKRKTTLLPAIFLLAGCLFFTGCISVLPKPSAMVSLGAFTDPGEIKEVRQGKPDGTSGGIFTVPRGRVLVVTRAIIHPINPGIGTLQLTFIQSDDKLGDRIRQTWIVPTARPTEFDFSPGFVISSGSIMKIENDTSSDGTAHVSIYGYIAAGR